MISISSCDPFSVETALLERPNHGFSHDFKTFHDDTYSDVSIGFHFKSIFHEGFYFRDFGPFCNHLMSQIPPDLYDILRGVIICSNSSPFDKPSSSGQNVKAEFKFQSPNIREYKSIPHNNIIKVGTFYSSQCTCENSPKPSKFSCSLNELFPCFRYHAMMTLM